MADEEVGQIRPQPAPELEFGVAQNLPFSTPYTDGTDETFNSDTDSPTVAQLVQMRKQDGQARALYRLITLPIRSALKGMIIQPPEEGGEEEAKFIEQMFVLPPFAGGMTTNFNRFMAQMLMAIFDGFTAFEKVYYVPSTGPLKGKIVLKKLAHRPSDTITFLTNEKGGFAGFRQRASVKGKSVDVKIPLERCLYYAANEEENPFYGVSYFQSAFYHYDKKRKMYYVAHLAAQRAAVGTRIGKAPLGASDRQKREFNAALARLGVAQSITLPTPEYEVESLKEGGTYDFMSMINHHNSAMSKSVLAGFFDDNQGAGQNDSALVNFGQQSDALFLMMLQTIMDDIAAIINTYVIPEFIDWNFGSGKYPEFVWGAFTDEQKAAITETFKVLGTAQTVSPEFLLELEEKVALELGLEIDYEAVKERKAQELEHAQAAQELAVAAQQQGVDAGAAAAAPKPSDDSFLAGAKPVSLSAEASSLLNLATELIESAADVSEE